MSKLTAKSKQKYVTAWNNHITEFTSVLFESGTPTSEWDAVLQPLRDKVNAAANKLEQEGTWL